MKRETLESVAGILGNGYKCYVNKSTEEVFSAADLNLEQQKSVDFQEFIPIEGPIVFGMMEQFTASVEDFEKQSQLMEALMYDQPFTTFKRKTYDVNLANEWIAYRMDKIVEILEKK